MMMNRFYTLFIIFTFTVFVLVSSAQAETRFFENLTDVPVMPGLEELEDQSLMFDKPEGRIIETMAAGEGLEKADIYRFYGESLPQLGWERIAENAFVRGQERMIIHVEEHDGYQLARFSVQPAM